MRRVRGNIIAVEKKYIFTYSESVSVALVIQHAMRMRCVTLSSLYHIFPHYHINGMIFEKQITEHCISHTQKKVDKNQ